jgi:hypothetical protein
MTPNPSNPTQTEDWNRGAVLQALAAHIREHHATGMPMGDGYSWGDALKALNPRPAAPTISPRGSEEAERLRAKYGVAYSTALEHMNSTVSVGLGDLRVLLASLSPRGRGEGLEAVRRLQNIAAFLSVEGATGDAIWLRDYAAALAASPVSGLEKGGETNQLIADLTLLQGTFKPGVIGHQIVSRALAALSSAPVSGGWQDIASAPKERFVLVATEKWGTVEAIRYVKGGWITFGCNGGMDIEPYAWMEKPAPLPPPPATGEVGT